MSVLFRLAGLPRYTEASTPYAHDVDAYFAKVHDHRAVTFTAQFGARYHYGFEMAPRLGAYLDASFRLIAPNAPSFPPDLSRWKDANLDVYLAAVRDFADTGHFSEFLDREKGYFDKVEAHDRALFDTVPMVDWYDKTFGRRPKAHYHLVPGLLTGPMDYAAHTEGPDGEDIYVIAHLDAVDGEGVPSPRPTALPFVAHELCHSYTNPIVDAKMAVLAPAATHAIDAVRDKMNQQAYGSDEIVIEESVVRAAVVLWARDRGGPSAGDTEIAQQEGLGFVWTRALADAFDAARKESGGSLSADAVVRATADVLGAR